MGNHYNQLTQVERYQIQALHQSHYSARAIARILQRSNATVSRELRTLKTYDAEQAQRSTEHRKRTAQKFSKLTVQEQHNLYWLLSLNLSPEQISGRLRLEYPDRAISLSTMYRWVLRMGLRKQLPRKGKRYRKRSGPEASVHLIPNRIDIKDRPSIVDQNEELGHWEGDTVHSKDGYLITLVERVSKLLLSVRVKHKTKRSISRAIKRMLRPYRAMCKTITFDNGGEFADHESIARALKCKIYFARPYCSWQRGLNENTNGLLRRYFPKGTVFSTISSQALKEAVFRINTRPRKALNYLSPYEFLLGKRVSLIM